MASAGADNPAKAPFIARPKADPVACANDRLCRLCQLRWLEQGPRQAAATVAEAIRPYFTLLANGTQQQSEFEECSDEGLAWPAGQRIAWFQWFRRHRIKLRFRESCGSVDPLSQTPRSSSHLRSQTKVYLASFRSYKAAAADVVLLRPRCLRT
jgi:hypothetical protein